MADIPSPMTWGTIRGNFGAMNADGPDAGLAPDLEPVQGTVTLTPRLPLVKIYSIPMIAVAKTIQCRIIDGRLIGPDNNPDVRVVASDSPGIEPSPLQWDVRINILGATQQPAPMTINVPSGGVVDLALVVPSPPAVPVVTVVTEETKVQAMSARDQAVSSATAAKSSEITTISARNTAVSARDTSVTASAAAVAANTQAQVAKVTAVSSAASAASDAARAEIARKGAEDAAGTGAEGFYDQTVAGFVEDENSLTYEAINSTFGKSSLVFSDEDFSSLQATLDAATPFSVVEIRKTHNMTDKVTVSKALDVRFMGLGSIVTTSLTADGILVTSSNVTIRDAKITGTGRANPGPATAIKLAGTWTNYLKNIHIINPRVNQYNKHAIWFEYVTDFSVINPQLYDLGYSGVITISCMRGKILGGHIKDIYRTPGIVNVYGIALTRDSTVPMSQSPRSEDILVSGVTVENVDWEGIDTHAGVNLTITNNTVLGCVAGIAIVGCPNEAREELYAPLGIICTNNYIDGKNNTGSMAQGIKFVGAGETIGMANEYATGIIANNIIVDHGNNVTNQGLWGGIIAYFTRGLIISNNVIIRPSGAGIQLYHTNDNILLSNNVIEDVWTTAGAVSSSVYVRSNTNNGTITGTQVSRGSKTGTLVNSRGLFINGSVDVRFVVDGTNRWSNATTPTVINASSPIRTSFFGAPDIPRPTSVPKTPEGIHKALTDLGLIS